MTDFGEFSNLLHSAIEASIHARKAILDVYGLEDFQVETKADESPLTLADRRSHNIIVEQLQKAFPDIPVLSEEGRDIPFEERSQWQRFWLVDPLDGTKEFVKRNGEFTINIALMEIDKPILGVVVVPVTGKLYFAAKNKGAYLGQIIDESDTVELLRQAVRLPVSIDPIKGRPVRVVASRSHFSDESRAFVKKLEKIYGQVELVNVGSALKLCVVAEGKADVYPRYAPTMEWDTAAGHIVATESECSVTVPGTDTTLKYNKQELRNPWFLVAKKGVISTLDSAYAAGE